MDKRYLPGKVRDAIHQAFRHLSSPLSVKEIENEIIRTLGPISSSSIRSYLRLNTPGTFTRVSRGVYMLNQENSLRESDEDTSEQGKVFCYGKAILYHEDCFRWLKQQPPNTIHAVVTDPPYGLLEYSEEQKEKLRNKKGGVWRIPPAFDGHQRLPVPRFTTLTEGQLNQLKVFFRSWGKCLLPVLVPGAHVLVASNPLLSYILSGALAEAGLERRGEIIRLTMTLRGGDRPKGAHLEFPDVSVMPRSMWEPWVLFRKPLEGRVQDNLRKWKTGAFRRPEKNQPFGDVIRSCPTRSSERKFAPHPSLKPQSFLRKVVHAMLPLGAGVILDPFAGSGSTLAASEAIGYSSLGIEIDPEYFTLAQNAIPQLAQYQANVTR